MEGNLTMDDLQLYIANQSFWNGSFPVWWNNLIETEEDFFMDKIGIRLLLIFIYTIVFLVDILGNTCVILILFLHGRMRQKTSKLVLVNLAIADLFVGVFCIYPNLSLYLIHSWILGNLMCKLYLFMHGFSYTASILTLTLVCVERYLTVVHPLKSRWLLTDRRCKMLVAGAWIASALYNSPRMLFSKTVRVPRMHDSELGTEVICTGSQVRFDSKTFDMVNSFLFYVLPLALMAVLYSRLARAIFKLWDHPRRKASLLSNSNHQISRRSRPLPASLKIPTPCTSNLSSQTTESPETATTPPGTPEFLPEDDGFQISSSALPPSALRQAKENFPCFAGQLSIPEPENDVSACPPEHARTPIGHMDSRIQRKGERRRRAVVRMLITIVAVFATCNLPFHLRKVMVYFSPAFDHGGTAGTILLIISHLGMYLNSALNPVIYYSFMSTEFQRSIRDLFQRWRRRRALDRRRRRIAVRESEQ